MGEILDTRRWESIGEPPNMKDMSTAQIIQLTQRTSAGRERPEGPGHVVKAAPQRPGRAWINGREVGGTEPRVAHLMQTYSG